MILFIYEIRKYSFKFYIVTLLNNKTYFYNNKFHISYLGFDIKNDFFHIDFAKVNIFFNNRLIFFRKNKFFFKNAFFAYIIFKQNK